MQMLVRTSTDTMLLTDMARGRLVAGGGWRLAVTAAPSTTCDATAFTRRATWEERRARLHSVCESYANCGYGIVTLITLCVCVDTEPVEGCSNIIFCYGFR